MTLDLDAHGYRRAGASRLWVRADADAPEFGYNDGDDYENWVAASVRDATDVSGFSREIEAHIRDWPSRYHLSHRRANLIRPLLGSLRGPVLEIGAGMGGVTRGLGEAGLEVVAVEGSPRRASVCADRVRDLENVQVVADTVQGFGRPRRFATVVMVGVLEYSRVFGFEADGRDPVDVMLEHLVSLLEPDGQLVVAIENQLGLKYFAGFPEDHVGRRMFGLEDRYTEDGVVTFGREELGRRLSSAGLTHHDWYYPFPDYKLPTTVVAEAALDPRHGFDVAPLVTGTAHADFQEPAVTALDLERAWGPVLRNGLLRDLSSSFLVRASARELTPAPGLAWYYGGASRRPEFAKSTVFEAAEGGVVVRREPARPELPRTVGTVEMHLEDERYAPGTPATDRLTAILGREGWRLADLVEWFGTWLDTFCSEAGLEPGSPSGSVVPGRLLDALPRNLLLDADGRARFVDLEWRTTDDLTLSFVVFRALYDSLASRRTVAAPQAGTPLTVRDLITGVAAPHGVRLTDAALAAHWERERAFQATVLGAPVEIDAPTALGAVLRVRTDLDAVVADHERLPAITAEHAAHAAAQAAELAATRAEAEAERVRSEEALAELDGRLTAALGSVEGLEREIAAQHATVSWRVTGPLRESRRLAGRAKRAAGRVRRRVSPPPAPAPAPAPVAEDPTVDTAFYRARYDDLASLDTPGLVAHWREFGRAEGRRGRSVLDEARVVERRRDPSRDTVMVVLHEATRTGAPVLGWNLVRELQERHDVVLVLLQGGELAPELEAAAAVTVTFDGTGSWHARDAQLVAATLAERFAPSYAIANSAATHPLAPSLEEAGVPVVVLVHEFASSVRPSGVLAAVYATVSEVVFSAPIVADSMRREYADLVSREAHVVPQGPSSLPGASAPQPRARRTPHGTDGVDADLPERDADELLAELEPGTVLVLGAGTIAPRKGVEFFLQAADQVRRSAPGAPVAFAWVGGRVPALQWYVEELHEQLLRSGSGTSVTFLAPVADLHPLFDRADLFLLSSRLDPLPNVTIDAALAGVPVVAFEGASGFAEWLADDDTLRQLVVPHLDGAAAGTLIAELADDAPRRRALGTSIRGAAQLAFDLSTYARRLEELGDAARRRREQEARDVATIAGEGDFDAELYAYADRDDATPDQLLREYVHRSALAAPRSRPRAGILVRRPTAGFHPLVYAEQAPGYDDVRDGDPYADFLRRGRPAGPWSREVLRPTGASVPPDAAGTRVLVHGHFHYPELVGDLLGRLSRNTHPVHLHLTTGTDEKAAELEAHLAASDQPSWEVQVVPNRGRDLGPLLTGLGTRVLDHDLVLHVHGKKSPHVDDAVGERWRTFLYENLVGGRAAMLDEIVAAFASRPELGLVSPEDPHLNDWDLDRADGEALAARFGLTTPLTTHFDFPLGTMFWARSEALRPVLEAGIVWDEYPEEPLPIDGTLLHALERLVPFVVADSGRTYAKTVVPGVVR